VWAEQLDPAGLSQGDLVDGLIFTNVHPVTAVERSSLKGASGWLNQPKLKTDGDGKCNVVCAARLGAGLILSHSCDIDKGQKKSRILAAPVLPITNLPDAEQASILSQRRIAHFPLAGTPRGDLYADLRLATAFDPRVLDEKNRFASMTDEGREMLHARLVMLFTRRE
jgi:hypothetical protein